MTASPRTAALSVLAVYWLMLILGMASCIAMRTDASIAAIWTGTVAGTALGHALALFNTRSWFALLTILTTAAIVGPSAPGELSGSTLWLAFIPAATCAYWSLGDRTTLVAFWFPAVIWMLSILDRAQANGVPDDAGIALLGVLALVFLLFLRVRETRRVALWTTVPAPSTLLAQPKPSVLLKERPGLRVARAGWGLVASAAAFAATAWVAPRLWQSESLPGEQSIVEGDAIAFGLPCCPVQQEITVPKARVKEYFAIGRGHDEQAIAEAPESCVRCEGQGAHATAGTTGPIGGSYPYGYVATGEPLYAPPVTDDYSAGRFGHYSATGTSIPSGAPSGTVGTPTAGTTVSPSQPYSPSFDWGAERVPNAPPGDQRTMPAPTPYVAPPVIEPPPPAIAPSQPPPQVATTEPPHVATTESPPPITTEPAPAAGPTPPPPVAAKHASASPTAKRRASTTVIGPSLIQWLAVIFGAAVLMQLAALGLRPLRRYVTLRHLRRPYWQETVDQRVSNAWQLALVGLRDAGWRADSDESPRDLAQRVGIDGVERCASILERARHGIGIDADDLSTMTESAEHAYHEARSKLGPMARATTWLRWPLT